MVTMCIECKHSRDMDKHGRCSVCGSSAVYTEQVPVPQPPATQDVKQ